MCLVFTKNMTNKFNNDVRQQVEQLKSKKLWEIEREISAKRILWVKNNVKENVTSPRKAFELLFFIYMGLSESELIVISETENEIEWLSRNDCPILEACKKLNLDTKIVCKFAYEKSTQAFLSQLNPQLRFSRSYSEIRPYHEHCREKITKISR